MLGGWLRRRRWRKRLDRPVQDRDWPQTADFGRTHLPCANGIVTIIVVAQKGKEKMDLIIPSIIVFVGNVFSGSPESRRWAVVTALFGWAGGLAGALWLTSLILGSEFWARHIFFPIFVLSLVQVLSRDGLRILKPQVDQWFNRHNLEK